MSNIVLSSGSREVGYRAVFIIRSSGIRLHIEKIVIHIFAAASTIRTTGSTVRVAIRMHVQKRLLAFAFDMHVQKRHRAFAFGARRKGGL